jgi:hypothetical protein
MAEAEQNKQKQLPEARKPYAAPKLRRLGSVRELTLGTGQAAADGGGPRSGNVMRGRG